MNTKKIQILAHQYLGDVHSNDSILRAAGVKNIHDGWYTVEYRGTSLEPSTVVSAKRNKNGEIQFT